MGTKTGMGVVETPNLGVSTYDHTNTNHQTRAASEKLKPASLGVIINQYKRILAINARQTQPNFAWQPRYYDHIIRNNNELGRIKSYIQHNSSNWEEDKMNRR